MLRPSREAARRLLATGNRRWATSVAEHTPYWGKQKLSKQQKETYDKMMEGTFRDDMFAAVDDVRKDGSRANLVNVAKTMEKSLMDTFDDIEHPDYDAMFPGLEREVLTPETAPGLTCDLTLFHPKDKPADGKLPALLYIHGGGMAILSGKEKGMDLEARMIASLGAVSGVVHFTNSTEEPFPRGLEDCCNAVNYMRSQSERLGMDPEKGVTVYGESGGGNLTLATAMKMRGTGAVSGAFARCPFTYGLGAVSNDPNIYPSWREFGFQDPKWADMAQDQSKIFVDLYTPVGSGDENNPLAWPHYATKA